SGCHCFGQPFGIRKHSAGLGARNQGFQLHLL
ncbi:MAG: hypothetical protein RJA26_1008, partial [Actinomycetota bacterium]